MLSRSRVWKYQTGVNNRLAVSVAIITLNEEANLVRCLESVREWASEIVVIDSGSTDQTRAIAERFGAIFEVHPWPGYVAQKNLALRRCSQPWVLCIDADEAVSPELASAIRQVLDGDPRENGFLINRLNWYFGTWIRHAWYPEWRLRLVRREQAEWVGLDAHERLEVKGGVRRLAGDLYHYPYESLSDQFQNNLRYARLMADSLERNHQPARWYHLVFSPWMAFFKVLILKSGWRDGWRGWVIAGSKWFNVFAKYAFLFERRWSPPKNDRRP